MNQDAANVRKKAMENPSTEGFYKESIGLAPIIQGLLSSGEIAADVKAASDWSYNASCYASPNLRIVGDAGCFIDPYFSSGVHLAFNSALSAATTIRAAQRGDVDEKTAMKWHSTKVSEGYTRFLLIVLSTLKQIREAENPILSDFDEDGFEKAFAFFRPIIQGNADVTGAKLTQNEVNNTVDFCLHAFEYHDPEKQKAMKEEMAKGVEIDPANLSEEELKILQSIRARQMLRSEDFLTTENFIDAIDGLAPRLKTGDLTLVSDNKSLVYKVNPLDLGNLDVEKLKEEVAKESQIVAAPAVGVEPQNSIAVGVK